MKAKKTKEVEFMGKYKLSADSYNIILREKQHNKKTDTDYWTNVAFFATPKNALKYIIEQEIRETWVDDLKVVVKEVNKLYQAIQSLNTEHLPQIV